MNAFLQLVGEQRVNHALACDARLARERCRLHRDIEVGFPHAVGRRTGVAVVALGVVIDLKPRRR